MIKTIHLNYLSTSGLLESKNLSSSRLFMDGAEVVPAKVCAPKKKQISKRSPVSYSSYEVVYEDVVTEYYVIEAKKASPILRDESAEWDDWAKSLVSIISAFADHLTADVVDVSVVRQVFDHIPQSYSAVKDKILNIEGEVFCDYDSSTQVSFKSFVSMLRFVPALEDKIPNIGFYVNEQSKRFGLTLTKKDRENKTLDLLFKEDGEIFFSYMDEGEGYSRISGSSYLTEYLSNSCKIRKILNIFDY